MTKSKHDVALAGHVDAFGLDEFGMPAGINPLWGAVAGTGLGTLAAIGVRQFAKPSVAEPLKMPAAVKYSEAIGFAVGGAASAAMLFSEKTRAAGWTGLASAFLNNGLRQIEILMLTKGAAATPTPTTPTVTGVEMEQTDVLKGSGMGLVDIEPTTALLGAAGYHEAGRDMPKLVGSSLAAANKYMTEEKGARPLSAFSSHWGATHFSGRG